jgi:hypothetical protein
VGVLYLGVPQTGLPEPALLPLQHRISAGVLYAVASVLLLLLVLPAAASFRWRSELGCLCMPVLPDLLLAWHGYTEPYGSYVCLATTDLLFNLYRGHSVQGIYRAFTLQDNITQHLYVYRTCRCCAFSCPVVWSFSMPLCMP